MISTISNLTEQNWKPSSTTIVEHFQRLNNQHKYFESEDKREILITLFTELVIACREVCVLIEKNNTPDDTMAYDYAYKIMALLIDENKPIPSFHELSKHIRKLLTPSDQALKIDAKPFHNHLLDLQLPNRQHDRTGWIAFIQKEALKALKFFTMAIRIEEKTSDKKAPKTLKQARDIAALLTYQRAEENIEWARLCYKNKVDENTFESGLNYLNSSSGWPKKSKDNIPDITIEDDVYIWTKLSPHDQRGLILGKITDCCQSIGGHSSQCVKDAASLSDNGLYVLLQRKKPTSRKIKTDDGLINDEDYQIIGQS